MTPTKLMIAIVSLLTLLGIAAAQIPPSAARGKQLYVTIGCIHCHGSIGQGSQAGPRLAPDPLPAAAAAQVIRATTTNMPAYPASVLDDAAIADIVAFLSTIKPGRDADRIPALNVAVEIAPSGQSPNGK